MDITDMPFRGDVHRAYTLALVSLLDLLYPEVDILQIITNLAENIYEEVITKNRLGSTGDSFGGTESGSETSETSDGSPKND